MTTQQVGTGSRITLVTEAFHPAVDASTVTVRHIADELVNRGHRVQIITSAPGMAVYRQCRVVRVRAWDGLGTQVRTAISEFASDVVVVATPGAIGSKALKHGTRLGVPTVTVEHGAPDRLSVEPWLTRVPNRSDLVLCVSEWQRERLSAAGVAATLWRPGVDTATFTSAARDEHLHAKWARAHHPGGPSVTVGYVGPLRKGDGVRRLRDLAAIPGIRPVVIGEGKQRDWLRSRLPSATFLPELASGELATAIASLDLLVHPGDSLTAGHVLRFAAACGTPVVASRAGGAREIVRHLETGLLFDGDGFADSVAALAADPHRVELGVRAHELVGRRTWQVAVDELLGDHLGSFLAQRIAAA